jgi:Arc/MetJ family transcription regulator
MLHHLMPVLPPQKENAMRTTVTLDDELLSQARTFTGIQENSALIQQALKTLVQREAALRLARLGGSAPGLRAAPRRRGKVADDPR